MLFCADRNGFLIRIALDSENYRDYEVNGMQYNVVIVFDPDKSHVLMCKRRKNPYQNKLNFTGGKIEKGEAHTDAAYRELREETSISKADITLIHIIDFHYVLENDLLEMYAGVLYRPVQVEGTENELLWIDVGEDFSDTARFAGCGNIYHMLNYLKTYESVIESNGKIDLT
jgi:8-oxo-dGTP diphosphatase